MSKKQINVGDKIIYNDEYCGIFARKIGKTSYQIKYKDGNARDNIQNVRLNELRVVNHKIDINDLVRCLHVSSVKVFKVKSVTTKRVRGGDARQSFYIVNEEDAKEIYYVNGEDIVLDSCFDTDVIVYIKEVDSKHFLSYSGSNEYCLIGKDEFGSTKYIPYKQCDIFGKNKNKLIFKKKTGDKIIVLRECHILFGKEAIVKSVNHEGKAAITYKDEIESKSYNHVYYGGFTYDELKIVNRRTDLNLKEINAEIPKKKLLTLREEYLLFKNKKLKKVKK